MLIIFEGINILRENTLEYLCQASSHYLMIIMIIVGDDGTGASPGSRFYYTSLTLPASPLLSLYRYMYAGSVCFK